MKIVMANGCFDGIHVGHMIHLKQAAAMGTRLVVAMTSDETVRKEKGWFRPVFNQKERAEHLLSLKFVDQVIVVSGISDALRKIEFDVFVKGPDYRVDTIDDETLFYCTSNQKDIKFTNGPKFSSTALLSQIFK